MIKTVESATMTIDTTTCPTQDTDVETSMFASYTAPAPAKNRKPSLDDVKAEKATKASSKTTIANKSSKGEKADELKDEKATKASSKATKASMTTKGKEADNLKNEKATKASSKATKANISQKVSCVEWMELASTKHNIHATTWLIDNTTPHCMRRALRLATSKLRTLDNNRGPARPQIFTPHLTSRSRTLRWAGLYPANPTVATQFWIDGGHSLCLFLFMSRRTRF